MMHYDLDTLDDYLHGELDGARDAAVLAHLETCEICQRAYDETAAVRDWIRAAAKAEEREFPSMVRAKVWDEIRHAPPAPFAWLRSGLRPWIAAPVAAGLALAAFLGVPAAHAPGPPAGVAASDLMLEHAAQMAANPLADHGLVVPASTSSTADPSSALIEAVDESPINDPARDGN